MRVECCLQAGSSGDWAPYRLCGRHPSFRWSRARRQWRCQRRGAGRKAPSLRRLADGGARAVGPPDADQTECTGALPKPSEEAPLEWASVEMMGARVPDRRIVQSLSRIVGRRAEQPEVAFSVAVGDAGRQAAWRVCRREDVSADDLLAGHVRATARRCEAYEFVLVAQDTTGLDFGNHRGTRGLGPTSNDPDSWGCFMHSALAVAPNGLPLGLLDATAWARDPAEYGKRATRQEREPEGKESYKWVDTLAAVEAAVEAAVKPGQRVVMLQDREGDIFAFLSASRRETTEVIVRAAQPRKVEVEGGEEGEGWERSTLFKATAGLPVAGELVITVPRKPGQAEREARLEVRFTRLYVLPDRWRRVARPGNAQEYWVVRASEAAAPAGEEPVEWVLLSSIPVTTLEEACRIVHFYTLRWLIERLHYTMKSGVRVERLQVDEAQALMKTIVLHLPAAWRLLSLTYAARTEPETPATQVLSEEEVAVLAQAEGKPIETVSEAVLAIAKLGGHVSYRSAGPPGVKRLWLGLRRLEAMVEGWRLARSALGPLVATGASLTPKL